VLNVVEVIPAKAQDFKEVEAPIRKIVYFDQLNKAVESWASKLRKASDVKIYADFTRENHA
jgi:hypothetical protein